VKKSAVDVRYGRPIAQFKRRVFELLNEHAPIVLYSVMFRQSTFGVECEQLASLGDDEDSFAIGVDLIGKLAVRQVWELAPLEMRLFLVILTSQIMWCVLFLAKKEELAALH